MTGWYAENVIEDAEDSANLNIILGEENIMRNLEICICLKIVMDFEKDVKVIGKIRNPLKNLSGDFLS